LESVEHEHNKISLGFTMLQVINSQSSLWRFLLIFEGLYRENYNWECGNQICSNISTGAMLGFKGWGEGIVSLLSKVVLIKYNYKLPCCPNPQPHKFFTFCTGLIILNTSFIFVVWRNPFHFFYVHKRSHSSSFTL
jgi:hypothetical protein